MHVNLRPATSWCLVALLAVVAAACRDPQAARARYVASAEKYLAEGKVAEAVIQYRNAVDQDPQSAELRGKLAETYLRAGDLGNALKTYIVAADLQPENATLQLKAGQLLLLARRFDDARARAEKVLARDEKNVDAQILLANSLAGLKDIDAAVAEMEEAVTLNPERGTTYANLGILEMGRGKRESAERAFKKAIELDPKSIPARMALANFYWVAGKAPETETTLQEAHGIDPAHVAVNRALAAFSLATNRPAAAEPYLKKVLEVTKAPAAAFALADYYIYRNNDAPAVALLEPMLEDAKTTTPASLRLAALDRRRGRSGEAYERVERVLASDPSNLQALLLKTSFLFADGKLDDAHGAAQAAVTAHKESAQAQFALARTLAARKQTDEAIKAYEEVLRLNPRATQAKVALSQLHLARGQVDTSVQLAQDAARTNPGDVRSRLLLVQGLLTRRELQRAETELDALTARYPKAPQVLVQMGVLRALQQKGAEARKHFDQALAIDPTSIEALSGHVALDLSTKRGEDARKRVDARLQAGDPPVRLLMLAAQTYSATGDLRGSEDLLRRIVVKDPAHMPAYGALGQLLVRQKRLDEARAEFETVAKKTPKPVGALTMIGTIHQTQGNTSGAREYYEKALQLDPEAAVAANNLAWMQANSGGNLDVALNLAQTAKRRLPDSAEVDDTLGFVYYKKGLASMAIPLFKRCVEKDARNPSYQSHLGLAYAKAGDAENARRYLTNAFKLKPEFDCADEARRVLESLSTQ